METQVIILANVHFCVVFKIQDGEPQIVDKYSSVVISDLREWLSQHGYPARGLILRLRQGADVAHGFYIKPYMTDRYFRVHEDDQIDEVDANDFDEPIKAEESFM